ncbi:hypothetical protein COU61_04205 [Candidatus Pacearchaeota archaeon CG10_big_fil_rev_8_21_14_0_10_35_13]|nr:MAG: hypothetical protein COU61_04205 [Candidatus Pacearchaeota archaeon CG10_big_fil_rev_8_21_14_0_10_35_13]
MNEGRKYEPKSIPECLKDSKYSEKFIEGITDTVYRIRTMISGLGGRVADYRTIHKKALENKALFNYDEVKGTITVYWNGEKGNLALVIGGPSYKDKLSPEDQRIHDLLKKENPGARDIIDKMKEKIRREKEEETRKTIQEGLDPQEELYEMLEEEASRKKFPERKKN